MCFYLKYILISKGIDWTLKCFNYLSIEPEEGVGKPIPSKWVQIQRRTYTFYHARFTWEEAAVYCRLLGARLAILSNSNVIEILANVMTKARPGKRIASNNDFTIEKNFQV